MDMLAIRRNRSFPAATHQGAGKAEKPAGSSQSQPAGKPTGLTVSDTLRQLMAGSGQAEYRVRESRQTLQLGEVVLAEVQDNLDRIAELVRESAGGGEPDRGRLQAELERLRGEIDRIMGSAAIGDVRLFLDADTGAEDGIGALLRAVVNELTAAQDGAPALPAWLSEEIAGNPLTAEQLLAALGLDRTASGGDILAAIADSTPEGRAAADYLAALYLGAVIAGGGYPEIVSPQDALEGLRQLLGKIMEGVPSDQAVRTMTDGEFSGISDYQKQFTGGFIPEMQKFLVNLLLANTVPVLTGSALLTMLSGFEGTDLELMIELLAALPNAEAGSQAGREAGPEGAPSEAAPQAAAEMVTPPGVNGGPEGAAVRAAGNVQPFGTVQVMGRDLSGVSVSNGVLVIGGRTDVTVVGTGQGDQTQPILMNGSGTVTLQNVKTSKIFINTAAARIYSVGESTAGAVQMRKGASLTFGGGLLKTGAFHADESNTLRLTGGAVVIKDRKSEALGALHASVIVDGPVSLAAQASRVSSPGGKPLEPFDVVWKVLLPGWSSVTAMTVDGHQARMAQEGRDLPAFARLWLEKGDPSHGYPVHTVAIKGRDETGQLRTRYAYLRWNGREGAFREISMYPNPFAVTGGGQDRDWVYEEASHTLRILSDRVSAVSGGIGTDANHTPFSGRIALADNIGRLELTLGGVTCRVSSGRAFYLGRGNDVMLLLQQGTDNLFESGRGCAGITLGDASSLCIDCAGSRGGSGNPAGTLTALGGTGGAGIGRDRAGSREKTSQIQILGGAVTAVGTGGGAGIGGALGAPVGNISIRGGTITAAASYHAAAIGAGIRGECGDILIAGTARIVKAQGGDPGADIGACLFGSCGKVLISGGANIGNARLWMRAGISLRAGDGAVTLPQFRLSSRDLQMDRLCVATREQAQAARIMIEADRRWVSQIQKAYRSLYRQMEQSGGQGGPIPGNPVRDTGMASTLLEDMRQSLLRSSAQTMRTHSGRGTGDVWQLLW